MGCVFEDLHNDACRSMERSRAIHWRYQSAPEWTKAINATDLLSNPILVSEWIRTCSEEGDKHQLQRQRRILLVYCVLGVDLVLRVSETTSDDYLSTAVYYAIQEYSSIFGLEPHDSQDILRRLLPVKMAHYSGPNWYVAYIALLGQLLEGTGRPGSWAYAVGLSPEEHDVEPHNSLLGNAVEKVLGLAQWWHRDNNPRGVRVVRQALGSLNDMFKGAKSLGSWHDKIQKFAFDFTWDYHFISEGLRSAEALRLFKPAA